MYTNIGALKTIENIGEYCRRILYYCVGYNDLIDIYEILKDYINIEKLIEIILQLKYNIIWTIYTV